MPVITVSLFVNQRLSISTPLLNRNPIPAQTRFCLSFNTTS